MGNLAVVINNTISATKSLDIFHYELNYSLQKTLEISELIYSFSDNIQNTVPHTGFSYTNDEFSLSINKGVVTQHSRTFTLEVETLQLGQLKIMRHRDFNHKENLQLESLFCCLIYPLRNAVLYKQAISMASTDPLTQTYNRTFFDDSLKREINLARRKSTPLSVIFFDIDNFKKINDKEGHECGDITLTAVAHCIKNALRSSDIIFRYGGEEFVILLTGTNLDGAQIIAEKIRKNIENLSIPYNQKIIKLTASIGISSLRGNDAPESLIKRADDAMYKSKKEGRNQVQIELAPRSIKEIEPSKKQINL